MTDKYFAEYTGIKVKQFRETLLQHVSNVKKIVAERTRHKRLYDRKVNKKNMQTQVSKVDMGKALDADLVVTKSSRTESEVQDISSRSENDTDNDDTEIRPIYDEEPIVEEVNLRKVKSHKNRNSNKLVEQKSHSQQPDRYIVTGHRFSPNKYSAMYEKMSPRSDLKWKPTGRILNTIGLRMPTKIELTLEQSQQGASDDVLGRMEILPESTSNGSTVGLRKKYRLNLKNDMPSRDK
nr:hypothetical protein [Tanacetum cinerariifolium]